MKKLVVSLLVLLICVLGGLTACGTGKNSSAGSEPDNTPAAATASVMSINIAGQDMTAAENVTTVKYPGQNGRQYTYALRRARLDALIQEYTPDVLFLQEVNGNNWWWPYLVTNEDSFLNTFTNYTLVGRTNRVGGSDGAGKVWYDLYNQLYYDHDKFEAVETGMFYLNVKRDQPFSSKWHESAKYSSDDNNTCVWAVLKDKETGISAVYASTHLKPTGGYLGRILTNYRQAVNLADGLYEIASTFGEDKALPIIVGGDFNLNIDHKLNYSYPYLTEAAHYSDVQKIAERTDTNGTARVWGKNKGSTSNDGSTSDGSRIDLFLTQGMTVSRYQCLDGTFIEDATGAYYTSERIFDGTAYDLSDHLPIMANIEISADHSEVLAPGATYKNTAADADQLLEGGESIATKTKLVFKGEDLIKYFTGGQYMQADAVVDGKYEGVLRLMATETCPNVYINFDYARLMADRSLKAADIAGYSKIRIVYKTVYTVSNAEFMVAVLNEGNNAINHAVNATVMTSSSAFEEKTFNIAKHEDASGAITTLVLGTMAYADDFNGTCGMFAGDCVYISSIELIA